METNSERIDKFLWSVRLFKTRNIAAEACKNKKVSINGTFVKPSFTVSKGNVFELKVPPAYRRYKIVQVLSNRVGAKLVQDYIEDITPDEIRAQLELNQEHVKLQRDRGTGRPTKKDRRDLNSFFE